MLKPTKFNNLFIVYNYSVLYLMEVLLGIIFYITTISLELDY